MYMRSMEVNVCTAVSGEAVLWPLESGLGVDGDWCARQCGRRDFPDIHTSAALRRRDCALQTCLPYIMAGATEDGKSNSGSLQPRHTHQPSATTLHSEVLPARTCRSSAMCWAIPPPPQHHLRERARLLAPRLRQMYLCDPFKLTIGHL